MKVWLFLHQPDGLGIAVRADLIDVVEQQADGTCIIYLEGDHGWRQVDETYEDLTRWLEFKVSPDTK